MYTVFDKNAFFVFIYKNITQILKNKTKILLRTNAFIKDFKTS